MIFEVLNKVLNIMGILGILGMGYFIGRIIEAWLIGSWNYPKKCLNGKVSEQGEKHG